ncbi:MAG: diguanylate cyclase [Bdellovibrionales bacterium]
MSASSISLLALTIDDHIDWMSAWTRMAIYGRQDKTASADALSAPESFPKWRNETANTVHDRVAFERLIDLYDQLHRLAKLALLRTPEGAAVAAKDYDAVESKYRELITGLRRFERALAAAESGIDALTGLRSRVGMLDDLTRELNRYLRTRKPFCIALMDIDHFKKVNDTYGHENGDKVLSSVSNFISRCVRPFDEIWRWGGEEILICLKDVDLMGGKNVLERLRTGLEKFPIKLLNGQEINVTGSFGLVSVYGDSTIEGMLSKADAALYAAKAGGRNTVKLAEF